MADKALEIASQISNKQITGIISYWYNGQWINIADTNQRNNMQKSIDNLSGLDKTIAALPHSYYSPDQPTGTSYNDTDRWYKTATDSDGTIKYTPYKWDSTTSSWQPMLDQSAIHAFVGSAPASPVEGDFWMDAGTLKQYEYGSWVIVPTHNNFTSQPIPPYRVGDTWTQAGATYFCTTARDSGAFTASDWTMQQITIQALDSSVTNSLYNDNLLTGTSSDSIVDDSSNTSQGWKYATVYDDLIVGSVYTFSSDVSVLGTATSIDVKPYNPTTGNTINDSYTTFSIVDGKISGLVKPTDGYTELLIYAGNSGNTHGNKVTFHHMKLEKGSVATPWCLSQSEITTTTGTYKGVTLNDAGLTATAGSTTVAMNSTDGFLIKNASGQVFHVDTAGNLTMQGDITAGNISGVNLAGNNLTLAGILAVTGAISNQFSYTDENQIQNVGETVISNGGMKSVANRTLPSGSDSEDSFLHVISYEFSPRGYRSFGYKSQADYTKDNPETITLYDDDGPYLTSGTQLESAYHLGGFSGNSLNDDGTISDKVLIQFGDMLQYASSEAQHSGSASYKDWFDIIAGIQSHPNLLHNSSLISGTNSWGGLTNGIVYPTNVTHDGNFAICIKSAGGSNFFYQDLQHIPDPGNPICISFWANIVKNDGGVNGGAFIKFIGANQNYTATLTNTKTGWQYYAFNPITVPSGTTGIQFNFYNNEHSGNQVYFAQPMVNIGAHTWPYMPTY